MKKIKVTQKKKIKVTQKQRDNLLEALHVMWPSVPEANVAEELADWRKDHKNTPPDCNTIACFGGWCAWWPSFREQGVRTNSLGEPIIGRSLSSDITSSKLFGLPALFALRGYFAGKIKLTTPAYLALNPPLEHDLFDHAAVTQRLRWLLDNSEVVEERSLPVVR